VVQWYKENGYNFCVITDHNFLTGVDGLNQIFSAEGKFIVIKGEEITDRFEARPVHIGAINITKVVPPQGGKSVGELIDNNADAVNNANGIAILNHPNGLLRSSISAQEIQQSKDIFLFEVCCADFKGGGGKPSTDEIWDSLLSAGKKIYGVAADDAHHFEPSSHQPGTAWVMVHSDELTVSAITNAISNGDFYSSTGVDINTIQVNSVKIQLQLSNKEGWGFKTFFIGKNGSILKIDESENPYYTFTSTDIYVRCRVERSDGAYAWTQPVFLKHS
jgi:hypothetical protein